MQTYSVAERDGHLKVSFLQLNCCGRTWWVSEQRDNNKIDLIAHVGFDPLAIVASDAGRFVHEINNAHDVDQIAVGIDHKIIWKRTPDERF